MAKAVLTKTHDRATVVRLYARLCRDSGFRLDYIQAAILLAKMLGCHPLEIWMTIGDFDNMQRVANGTHPYLQKEGLCP